MTTYAPALSLVREPQRPALPVLQLGMGWFDQQAGGLNRYYADLLAHLPGAGVAPRGLVCADRRVEAQVPVTRFASPTDGLGHRWIAMRRHLAQELADTPPALVAAHFALYARPVLNLLEDLPLVVHFHGPWADECRVEGSSRLARLARHTIERAVYRRAARLITLSQAFKNLLVERYGVSPDHVDVVSGGVDVQRFSVGMSRGEARARLGWPTDRPIALAVRRLARRMGLENLVEATDRVRRAVPDALVLIAGAGRLFQELHERINAAGLCEHVKLLGFLPDAQLPLAYRAADVTVVPSVALEGFGLIAAESLAAGTPSLVTPVGGLPEVVAPLATSLVLGGSDVASLAGGLTAVLADPLSLPDSSRCRQYARRHFAWGQVAWRVAEVYRQAAAGGGA